jgi:rubredoxin
MGRVPITIMGYRCDRCGYEWLPHEGEPEPKICPKCASTFWDIPKKQVPMSYEEFCNAIKSILKTPEILLTWTEIRTQAKLPQKFPNNQWVHRMEKDIDLIRERDKNGIIRWRISPK